MAEVRQLKIKTGSVRRLRKELDYYRDQVKLDREKLDKLRAQGLEQHDLQQAEKVLAESKAMIPDTKQRLETATEDLKKLLEEMGDTLQDEEDYIVANTMVTEVESVIA